MRKKMLSLALALIMCLSLMPSAFAAETVSASDKFTDVPANAWYLDELNYAVANGYISGTSATTFSPDATITRGQFVTILGRMLGVSTASGQTKFTDVKADSWYAPYVAWAAEQGFVNGTSSTTFSPDTNITVEQMSTILANYISKSGTMLKCYTQSDVYKDASSVSGWAVANVETMRQYGLLHIDANGNVNPRKDASRAEGAYTLVKFAQGAGLGEEPTIIEKPVVEQKPVSVKRSDIVQSSDTAEAAAKKIHDALWAGGYINSSMTQKEKAWVYYDWMGANCVPDLSISKPHIHDAYGALVNGIAVCDGNAKGYNLLLKTEGIECSMVTTADHAWTSAILDGVELHIDGFESIFCCTSEDMWAHQTSGKSVYGETMPSVFDTTDYPSDAGYDDFLDEILKGMFGG